MNIVTNHATLNMSFVKNCATLNMNFANNGAILKNEDIYSIFKTERKKVADHIVT